MDTPQSVAELIGAAQATAKTAEAEIAQLDVLMTQQATEPQIKDRAAAVRAIEAAAIDAFTLFEARMQHHFKRGPFSRKLKAKLLDAGQADLAGRVHDYYLAVNVLKHGTGASYRELLSKPTPLFAVIRTEEINTDAPTGLVDVSAPGFFDGLASTLLEAHDFLENR